MDYHSLHGQDVTNLSSPSPHRMPTISATQALAQLQDPISQAVSTGVRELDLALQNRFETSGQDVGLPGGVARGHITEVYGAPGVGKSTLGIQIAVKALSAGQNVIWIDAADPVSGTRIAQILSAQRKQLKDNPPSESDQSHELDILKNFSHFVTPSLPHLVALLCHATPGFPPENTALVIIDSLSSLITSSFPRAPDLASTPRKPGHTIKNDPAHIAAARKWPVLQYILTALQKMAIIRNLAVVMLNGTVTKIQAGEGAILVPAISSDAWNAGISNRVVLFRDWGWDGQEVRFASVMKAMGTNINGQGDLGRVVAFVIEDDGLKGIKLPEAIPIPVRILKADPSRKRKVDEILDSEDEGGDEDYGWTAEDNEQLPSPPPQWQGSEDILVPGPEDLVDEGEEREEEEEEEEADEEGVEGGIGAPPREDEDEDADPLG